MTGWSLVFTDEAEADLAKIDTALQKRIIEKLDWLCDNFDNINPLALSNQWRGFFKLRIGDWRVAYKVDRDKSLIIVWLIHRRDKVYKRIK